jgi:NRPS condensation-like uncharacterized protein
MTASQVADRLPFTVVDEAIHHLDTESEPWSIEVEVAIDGRLDAEHLRRALDQALARHPMTRAHRLPARRTDRTYTWELTPTADLDPLSVFECSGTEHLKAERDRLASLGVPLAESPPFRLRLARCPDGDVLMMNSNHAAFDGFGCVRLLQSVARAYSGQDDPVPDVDLTDARDVERHLATRDVKVLAKRAMAMAGKVADLFRPPARLAPDGGTDEPGYRIVHRSLSAQDSADVAAVEGATVNDLLMTALHLAADGWNTDHGAATGRVGVLMPVNLRPRDWRDEVVTNFVLVARVATTQTDRTDPRSALAAVERQTRDVKQWGTGAALVEVLGRSRRLPLWVRSALSPALWLTGNRLVDTALFSNLGTVAEPPAFGPGAGDTTGIWFSAPTRLPSALSVGAASVGGRLHLSFRWRRPAVGRAAAEAFADRYLGALASLVGAVERA